jgi:signal transduction histidine kinase
VEEEEPRWTTPVGLAVVGLVVVANAVGGVGLGTTGNALVVTVSVAIYCVSAVVFLLWFGAPPAVTVVLLLVMGFSATATHHGDPTGTGGIGLYLGVAFAPLRLPLRTAAVVSLVVVAAFDVQLALEAANPLVFILVVDGGAAFFFLLGTLLRREREQRLEVARLVGELEASREAEKASAALAERSRLAREMHDVLAHTLSGLALQVQGARSLARAVVPAGPDGEELVSVLDRAHTLARDGLAEARQAIGALRGARLPGPELLPALVEEHRRAQTGGCRLDIAGEPLPLPAEARLALYRTAQEALSNVRKHAPGAPVEVRLDWRPARVCLVVENGGGRPADPEVSAAGAGYGLTGMAERARLLGGDLAAAPTAAGFRVALRLPVPQQGVQEVPRVQQVQEVQP